MRGGKRVGAGRPMADDRPSSVKSLKLADEYWEIAKRIGNGVMAKGVRRALDAYGTTAASVPVMESPRDEVDKMPDTIEEWRKWCSDNGLNDCPRVYSDPQFVSWAKRQYERVNG